MATASQVLKKAAAEIGYCRWDDSETGTKYGRWYAELTNSSYFGTNGVPFCAMFVSWVLNQCGVSLTGFPTAACVTIKNGAKNAGKWKSGHSGIAKGDIVLFDWDGDGTPDHVGFVEKVYSSYIQTIEGNTTGSDGRSGSVARKTRAFSTIDGYYNVSYSSSSSSSGSSSSSSSGSSSGSIDLGADLTIWGPKFTKALQKQRGTTQDGYISSQPTSNKTYFWAVESGTVKWASKATGSTVIKSLQNFLIKKGYSCGSDGADGFYGKNTIKAHQKWLKAQGYSIGSSGVDGYHGHDTNKAMAKALKAGKYK